jgi:hypothetical protein
MTKIDRTVVRNKAYPRNNFSIRERHNERKNEVYSNPDIVQDRSYLNISFKNCESTYTQAFDKLLEERTISTRGLKPDADVFVEMVYDVNTSYFDEHGGYDYAKDFFLEAYRMAVQEVGGEQYILSAVMHADERNKSLSEELNRDVYHYHLHVVYIPLMEKEIRWTKLFMSTRDFKEAMQLAPQRVKEVFAEIFLKDREEREARSNMRRISRKRDEYER